MRKNAFFLLLLLLLLLTLSGCGDSIAPETEKVSLTALQYELENQTLDFDNMWFFQQIEEQTGVHVDFDVVKLSDWTNRVNLMFASGRPDSARQPGRGGLRRDAACDSAAG